MSVYYSAFLVSICVQLVKLLCNFNTHTMTYIEIELVLEQETALQIAKCLRKHLPDIWREIAEAIREADKRNEMSVNLN
jgi:DNA-binding XRE family transcriptional regulator